MGHLREGGDLCLWFLTDRLNTTAIPRDAHSTLVQPPTLVTIPPTLVTKLTKVTRNSKVSESESNSAEPRPCCCPVSAMAGLRFLPLLLAESAQRFQTTAGRVPWQTLHRAARPGTQSQGHPGAVDFPGSIGRADDLVVLPILHPLLGWIGYSEAMISWELVLQLKAVGFVTSGLD